MDSHQIVRTQFFTKYIIQINSPLHSAVCLLFVRMDSHTHRRELVCKAIGCELDQIQTIT